MRMVLVGLTALFGSGPALAQDVVGDATAGAEKFAASCAQCHVVANEAGEILAEGKPGPGPNLFGLAGRLPASIPGHYYTPVMVAYAELEVPWDEASFVAFVPDPTAFLQGATGMEPGPTAFSRMPTNLVYNEKEAHDLWAYLVSLSPPE